MAIRICFFLLISFSIFGEDPSISLPFPDSPPNQPRGEEPKTGEKIWEGREFLREYIENPEKKDTNSEPKSIAPEERPINGSILSSTPKPKEKDKKKKSKDKSDPSIAPFQRGILQQGRGNLEKAKSEFKDASSKMGERSDDSRLEEVKNLGESGSASQAEEIIKQVIDEDKKWKTRMEYARSLSKKDRERAIQEYLTIATESSKDSIYPAKAYLAAGLLLNEGKEWKSSIQPFFRIVKDFPDSLESPTAHYFLGKIYTTNWEGKSPEKAKYFWNQYQKLKSEGKEFFQNHEYSTLVEDGLQNLK